MGQPCPCTDRAFVAVAMLWGPIKARAPRSGRLVHRNNDPAGILRGQSPHDVNIDLACAVHLGHQK